MESKEISPAAGIGIAVALAALVGGLVWWRTGSGTIGGSGAYSSQVQIREQNASEDALSGERKVRQANPEAFRAERELKRDKEPQYEETR